MAGGQLNARAVFSREYQVCDIIEGRVTEPVPFGAFVSVMEEVEVLVHVSEGAVLRRVILDAGAHHWSTWRSSISSCLAAPAPDYA